MTRPTPIRKDEVKDKKQEEINRMVDHYTIQINSVLREGNLTWEIPLRIVHQYNHVLNILMNNYRRYWDVKRKVCGSKEYLIFS